jgi:MFS family permease
MSSMPNIQRHGRVLVISGLLFCVALSAFALSPWFWVGVALLVVVGITSTVFTTMIATVIQLRVPRELRGRVISLYAITLIGLPSLGSLGIAKIAQDLNTHQADWSAWLFPLLDALGITALTERSSASPGAPRAIVVGALTLLLVLLLTAPMFVSLRAATETPAQT